MPRSRAVRDNVVVGISGFQDYKGLAKLAEQVCPHVYKVVYVDGVYDFFKLKSNQTPYSTDGSLELCDKYDNMECIKFSGYQPKKRQQYADRAAELGAVCLLILDTDEWVHPKWQNWDAFYDQLEEQVEKFGRFHRVWNVMIHVDESYELALNGVTRGEWSIGSGRIWYRPEELEYYGGVHYWVHRKGTADPFERLMSTDKTIDQGVRFYTSTEMRTPEFKEARNQWAQLGMDYEENLINQYNHNVVNALTAITRNVDPDFKLYPLICVPQFYDNPFREQGIIQNTKYADLMFIRDANTSVGQRRALSTALKYFRDHSGYSHLVIAPFHMNWTKENYLTLYNQVKREDYTILNGFTYKSRVGYGHGEDREPRANFCLPNEDKITGTNELRSNATRDEIVTYFKLFRQQVIPIQKLEDFAMTFIRNDIVKFIGEIDITESPNYHEPTAAEALSDRLQSLGIMQFVDLTCQVESFDVNQHNELVPLLALHEHIPSTKIVEGKY